MPRLGGCEKRNGKRFAMNCPVSLKVLGRGKRHEAERGELLDVGEGGARLHLSQPLPVGTRVMLDICFPTSGAATTVRFEGTVTRAHEQPRYEIVVRFRGNGAILRNELGALFTLPPRPRVENTARRGGESMRTRRRRRKAEGSGLGSAA